MSVSLASFAKDAADGQPVTIEEQTAPFRVITLAGRDRPEAPVTVSSNQRLIQTRYPGTRRASKQVMGTGEDDIVLRGWLRDPLSILNLQTLNDGRTVGGPERGVAEIRGVLQGLGLCKLVWGQSIVRYGTVSQAVVEYYRQHKIRYEITFSVDCADEAIAMTNTIPKPVIFDLLAIADEARLAVGRALEVVDTAKTIGSILL